MRKVIIGLVATAVGVALLVGYPTSRGANLICELVTRAPAGTTHPPGAGHPAATAHPASSPEPVVMTGPGSSDPMAEGCR